MERHKIENKIKINSSNHIRFNISFEELGMGASEFSVPRAKAYL